MNKFNLDNLPFVQARWYTDATRRSGDIKWVVIHDMEAPEESTTAEAVANYFHSTDKKSSAHVCIDSDGAVRCVKDEDIAYHVGGGNRYGLGIEIAGYARQSKDEWLDAYSVLALDNAANVAAQYSIRYGIPLRRLTVSQLQNGELGFAGHVDITNAFNKSTHTDPGPNFPWDFFMQRVQKWVNQYTRRYTMLVYASRATGGPDMLSALAAVAAKNVQAVVSVNLAEANAAVNRGELVVAVGGPAIRDLGWDSWAEKGAVKSNGNRRAVWGRTGEDTYRLAVMAV